MIRGDNPAAHCFALRDLISTTFCKQLMIFSLKMHSSGKIFGKISLRAIRDTFRWSDIKQKGKVQTFWLVGRIPPPKKKIPLLVEHPDLPIRKTLRRVFDLLTVMILKRVSESVFFQINKFTYVKVKIKRRWQILW